MTLDEMIKAKESEIDSIQYNMNLYIKKNERRQREIRNEIYALKARKEIDSRRVAGELAKFKPVIF